MNNSQATWRRLATAAAATVTLVCSTLVATSLPATAATPAPVAAPAGPSTVLTGTQAGLPGTVSLAGPNSSQTLSIPVPSGLSLLAMSGTVTVPAGSAAGAIEFSSPTGVLGTVTLPVGDPSQPTIPFIVRLTDAVAVNGVIAVTTTYRSATSLPQLICGVTQPVTLTSLSIGYSGTATEPTSITTFLPPILQTLDLYVPSHPSAAVEQAALDLEVQTVARYAPQPVTVVLHTWDGATNVPGVAPAAFERTILVRSSSQAGSALETDAFGAPVLVMSGEGQSLDNQTIVLSGAPNATAQGTTAAVRNVGPVPSIASLRQSLAQLGVSGSVTGVGSLQLGLGIPEAKFGGAVSSYNVHLVAHYTPVASSEKGTAVISVGSKVLSTNLLGTSGLLTTNLTIPTQLITQNTALQFAINYYPAGGCASSGRVMSFSVDPQSFITASLVSGGAGGFGVLGAGLLPTFEVGLGSASPLNELNIALQVTRSIQETSSVLLAPKVTSLSNVVSSSQPALIVAPSSEVPSSLDPPVMLKPKTTSTIDGPQGTQVGTNASVATLQVFNQTNTNRTTVLAMTSADWQNFAPIEQQLSTFGAWSSLTGDTLLVGPAGQVSDLAIRAGGPSQLALAPNTGTNLIWIGLAASALVIVVLLLAIAGLSRRRKRQRRTGALS